MSDHSWQYAPPTSPAFTAVHVLAGALDTLRSEDVYAGITRPEWMREAACRAFPTEQFYPPSPKDSPDTSRGVVAAAKAVCVTCTVRAPCLAYALDQNEGHGIWGGMTVIERRRVKSRGRGRVSPAPSSSWQTVA